MPTTKNCIQCGKVFSSYPSAKRKFCSPACGYKGKYTLEVRKKMSDSHKGKPAKNKGVKYSDEVKKKMSAGKQGVSLKEWGGFAKTKDTLERAKFRKEIQKLVLERDNYTCQMCEERGGQLQVDHIQSWKDYTELRFDINNCRTLCMDCHYLITFGRKKPTGVVWGHNLKHKLNSLTA